MGDDCCVDGVGGGMVVTSGDGMVVWMRWQLMLTTHHLSQVVWYRVRTTVVVMGWYCVKGLKFLDPSHSHRTTIPLPSLYHPIKYHASPAFLSFHAVLQGSFAPKTNHGTHRQSKSRNIFFCILFHIPLFVCLEVLLCRSRPRAWTFFISKDLFLETYF